MTLKCVWISWQNFIKNVTCVTFLIEDSNNIHFGAARAWVDSGKTYFSSLTFLKKNFSWISKLGRKTVDTSHIRTTDEPTNRRLTFSNGCDDDANLNSLLVTSPTTLELSPPLGRYSDSATTYDATAIGNKSVCYCSPTAYTWAYLSIELIRNFLLILEIF